MPQQSLVSVVLCTYNGASYLQEQLDSIFLQTYQEIEVLVVDDASTDNTMDLLYHYQQKQPGMKIFLNDRNTGYNKNFEKGCGLASGEYIAIADQDDIWDHRKIALLVQALEKSPQTILAHCNSATFETGKQPHFGSVRAKQIFNGNDVRKLFLYNQVSGHNMLFRKSLLGLALPFPDNIYYDWWLAVTACCNGTIQGTDAILVYQRKHAGNATGIEKKLPFFYQAVQQRLPIILTAPNLSAEAKLFGETLIEKFSLLNHQEQSFRLFWLIVKHARTIFSFKRKMFPYFSYLKHAARISSASCSTP